MRRALLAVFLLGSVFAAAGCREDAAPPGPPTVTVRPRLEDPAATYVGAVAASLASHVGVPVTVAKASTETPEGPTVTIEGWAPAEGAALAIPVRFWAAFASFWSPAEELSFDGLRRAVAGEVTDWAGLGAPADALTVYLPLALRPPLQTLIRPPP